MWYQYQANKVSGDVDITTHGDDDFELNRTTEDGVRAPVQQRAANRRSLTPVLVVGGIVSAAFLVSYQYYGLSKPSVQSLFSSDGTGTGATVPVLLSLQRDGYDPLPYFLVGANPITKYAFLADARAVLEPNVPMNLYVSDFEEDDTTSYYTFDICQYNDDKSVSTNCQSGVRSNSVDGVTSQSVITSCTPFDRYSVVATQVSVDTKETLRTLSGDATCMYVRREIRDLTEADLSKTMDAMFALWSTDEATGQARYGENFHAATYFAEAHHFNAAWVDGDHVHEGLGFMTQHIKLTNIFEQAMQAVDPSVSLPYWDYTIEGSTDDTVFTSFVFTKEVFGTLIPPVSHDLGWTYEHDNILDGRIQDGRWANITVDTSRFEDLTFSYGYLRAPWYVYIAVCTSVACLLMSSCSLCVGMRILRPMCLVSPRTPRRCRSVATSTVGSMITQPSWISCRSPRMAPTHRCTVPWARSTAATC
jgi:hypothetical protein